MAMLFLLAAAALQCAHGGHVADNASATSNSHAGGAQSPSTSEPPPATTEVHADHAHKGDGAPNVTDSVSSTGGLAGSTSAGTAHDSKKHVVEAGAVEADEPETHGGGGHPREGGSHAHGESAVSEPTPAPEEAHAGGAHQGDAGAPKEHGAEAHGHEAHGHEAHGHEAHGHGGEELDESRVVVGRALGYSLLGSVAWIMLFYYQLNSSDPDIVVATRHILYEMVSIFVAVLVFHSSKQVAIDFFGEGDGHHQAPPGEKDILIAAGRFFLMYAIVLALLLCLRHRQNHRLWALTVVAGIGGHTTGFAAIDFFGNLLEVERVGSSIFVASAVTAALLGTLLVLFWGQSRCLYNFTENDHQWVDVVIECDNDGACLCLGLMLSMIVRDAISHKMPALHGNPKGKDNWQVWALFGVAAAFGVVVVALASAIARVQRQNRQKSMELAAQEDTAQMVEGHPSISSDEDLPQPPKRNLLFGCCKREDPTLRAGSDSPSWPPQSSDGDLRSCDTRPLMTTMSKERYHGLSHGVLRQPPSLAERALQMLQMTLSLAMGWCLLYWGQWFFWNLTSGKGVGTGAEMTSRMFMSMTFTVLCFIGIRVVDFFADHAPRNTARGLRELLKVFGLVMGLAWEACFLQAVEDITVGFSGHQRTLLVAGCTLALGAVVVPAWALYILPPVLEAEEEERREQEEAHYALATH